MSDTNQDKLKRLAMKLRQSQPMDDDGQAERLALKILETDQDIVEAALYWADTGNMAPGPSVAGNTPASLAQHYYPSQVFGWLAAYRADPDVAAMMRETFHGPKPT